MNRWVIAAGFGVLLLLGLLCARVDAIRISSALETNVNQQLSSAGVATVAATADGQHITLTGTVPNAESRKLALLAAQEQDGVVVVEDNIGIQTASIELSEDKTLTLSGHIGSESHRQSMLASLTERLPGVSIIDELTVIEATPDWWGSALDAGTSRLDAFTSAKVTLENGTLHVTGQVEDAIIVNQVVTSVASTSPSAVKPQFNIVSPPPPSTAEPGGSIAAVTPPTPVIEQGSATLARVDDDPITANDSPAPAPAIVGIHSEPGSTPNTDSAVTVAKADPENTSADAPETSIVTPDVATTEPAADPVIVETAASTPDLSDSQIAVSDDGNNVADQSAAEEPLATVTNDSTSIVAPVTPTMPPLPDITTTGVSSTQNAGADETATITNEVAGTSPNVVGVDIQANSDLSVFTDDIQQRVPDSTGVSTDMVIGEQNPDTPGMTMGETTRHDPITINVPEDNAPLADNDIAETFVTIESLSNAATDTPTETGEIQINNIETPTLDPQTSFVEATPVPEGDLPLVADEIQIDGDLDKEEPLVVVDTTPSTETLSRIAGIDDSTRMPVNPATQLPQIEDEPDTASDAESESFTAKLAAIAALDAQNKQESDTTPGTTDAITIPTASYLTRYTFDGGGIVLEGTAPDDDAREWLVETARQRAPDGEVLAHLTVADEDIPGWQAVMQALDAGIIYYDNATATVSKGFIGIIGNVSNEATRDFAQSAISGKIPEGYDLSFSVAVNAERAKSVQLSSGAINCQTQLNELFAGTVVLFETASHSLSAAGESLLNTVSTILANCPDFGITVAGWTDPRGRASYNQKLSERRATSVASYLSTLGIADDRLFPIGRGETFEIGDDDADFLERSRRVELIVRNK